MRMTKILLAMMMIFLAALSARADELDRAAGKWRVDPSSVILFSVGQIGGGGIKGRFSAFSGRFTLDPDLAKASVSFDLDAASVDAGEPRITEFMKSDAVFDVANFPTISFRSTKITRTGTDAARIEGRLTARGLTRTVGFDAIFEGRAGSTIRFRVTGKMSRALFGMEVGTPIYSNMVAFDMQMVGRRD